MNKQQIVEQIAGKTGMTKKDSIKFMELFMQIIKKSLSEGKRVQITGFGTFSVLNRKKRTVRNPVTGERIEIKAISVPKFKPSKRLIESLN